MSNVGQRTWLMKINWNIGLMFYFFLKNISFIRWRQALWWAESGPYPGQPDDHQEVAATSPRVSHGHICSRLAHWWRRVFRLHWLLCKGTKSPDNNTLHKLCTPYSYVEGRLHVGSIILCIRDKHKLIFKKIILPLPSLFFLFVFNS